MFQPLPDPDFDREVVWIASDRDRQRPVSRDHATQEPALLRLDHRSLIAGGRGLNSEPLVLEVALDLPLQSVQIGALALVMELLLTNHQFLLTVFTTPKGRFECPRAASNWLKWLKLAWDGSYRWTERSNS